MKLKITLLVYITTLIFTLIACSSDDSDSASWEKLIATEWTMDDGTYIVFNEDGTGFEKPSKSSSSSEKFTWSINGRTLVLVYDDETEIFIISSLSPTELTLTDEDGDSIVLTTSKPVDTGDKKEEDSSKYDKALIGEWWKGDVLKSLTKRYFCPNGKGYEILTSRDNDYGIRYNSFLWEINDEGNLSMTYGSSTPDIYSYEISDKKLVLTPIPNNKYDIKYEYSYKGSEYDENFDATKLPFANYLKGGGYYYEITKVTSGCDHAGTGDNMNEQFLHFFGSDGKLTTTGLRIFYYTPRWDGIDSYWASGTYYMSFPSAAYKYSAMGYWDGRRADIYSGAKLTITRSGSITTYDFVDKEIELHVATSK
ncbi:MAG: lipocalin family protein [Clostridium sp.]|nr:lipocalin family protein [Clostridium sp.]